MRKSKKLYRCYLYRARIWLQVEGIRVPIQRSGVVIKLGLFRICSSKPQS